MKIKSLVLTMAIAAGSLATTAETRLEQGRWSIVNADDNTLNFSFDGKEAINGAYAEATYRIAGTDKSGSISTTSMSPVSVTIVPVEDELGAGQALTRVYEDGTARMTHTVNLYDAAPFAIAQVVVESTTSGEIIESNHMVALASQTRSQMPKGTSHRMIWVPFDNDGHGRYKVQDFSREMISHEVACVFDATTKAGLVLGSVDHDKWKSGITVRGGYKRFLDGFELLSGHTSELTRDYDWHTNKVIPHGYVKGQKAESARYLIGFFDDWRVGMETFAETCATITPPAPWDGGNPMGWSTWGVMQDNVNTPAVKETSQWIKDNLFDLGFRDKYDQTVVSLDSYCDGWGMSSSEISQLGNRFLSDGTYKEGLVTKQGLNQRLGLYGGMVIWEWSFDSQVPGTGMGGIPTYKWGDLLLKHEGRDHRLFNGGQYCAIDPTHPAFYHNMEYTLKRWAAWKIKYIKMDFINCGICEGDSWYNPEITTGVMAYNYGMKIIYELAQKYDMYVLESMAPLFPYQWAHGRRTCCDRFSELGESEYVMNAMSWGWWTDRLYAVNDPDHLVLHKANAGHRETEGENRVRVTTGMCTGAFLLGDSFSDKCVYVENKNGHSKGDVVAYPEESKARALKMFGNADINAYVRENTGSFRPVDCSSFTVSQQSARIFMRDTPDYVYVAVFNFNKSVDSSGSILLKEIGIESSNIKEIKELWTGEMVKHQATSFEYKVPAGDVRVFRIAKAVSGVDDIISDKTDSHSVSAIINGNECVVSASAEMSEVKLYDLSGRILASVNDINHIQAVFEVNVQSGVYILNVVMADGTMLSKKIAAR